jgi:hypothetical protein
MAQQAIRPRLSMASEIAHQELRGHGIRVVTVYPVRLPVEARAWGTPRPGWPAAVGVGQISLESGGDAVQQFTVPRVCGRGQRHQYAQHRYLQSRGNPIPTDHGSPRTSVIPGPGGCPDARAAVSCRCPRDARRRRISANSPQRTPRTRRALPGHPERSPDIRGSSRTSLVLRGRPAESPRIRGPSLCVLGALCGESSPAAMIGAVERPDGFAHHPSEPEDLDHSSTCPRAGGASNTATSSGPTDALGAWWNAPAGIWRVSEGGPMETRLTRSRSDVMVGGEVVCRHWNDARVRQLPSGASVLAPVWSILVIVAWDARAVNFSGCEGFRPHVHPPRRAGRVSRPEVADPERGGVQPDGGALPGVAPRSGARAGATAGDVGSRILLCLIAGKCGICLAPRRRW